MAKLPYQKTTIRDLSQFTNIGDGSSGLNIATIINSKTGPMERVTLTSFDDLVTYYCTGTKITQGADTTLQCVGALLNTSAVDVIRVGSSNMRVGKTDNGRIVYTDSNYDLIDKLTRLTFADKSEKPDTIAISTDDYTYYLGDDPDIDKVSNAVKLDATGTVETTLVDFTRCLSNELDSELGTISYTNDEIYYLNPYSLYDTYLTTVSPTYLNVDLTISVADNASDVSVNDAIIINDTSYVFNGSGDNSNLQIFEEPVVAIDWFADNIEPKKFLANVVANMDSQNLVAATVKLNTDDITDCSPNLKKRIIGHRYSYSKSDVIDSCYFASNTESVKTVYVYNNYELPEEYTTGNVRDLYTVGSSVFNEDAEQLEGDIPGIQKVIESKIASVVQYNGSIYSIVDNDYYKVTGILDNKLELSETKETDTSVLETLQSEDVNHVQYTGEYVVKSYTGDYTDFIQILNGFERMQKSELMQATDVILYMIDSTVIYTNADYNPFVKSTSVDGIYKVVFERIEYQSEDYSVYIDGHVYYCGKEPTQYTDIIDSVSLSDSGMTFDSFIAALISQLQADMIVGYVNTTTIMLKGDITIEKSNNLSIAKSIINQIDNLSGSKFALIAKFPSSQKLFSYSFVLNTEITDYDIFDITWTYNQITRDISVGFNEDACDGFGTSLYYNKYNEGDDANDFFHILRLNDFVELEEDEVSKYTDTVKYIDPFGNELLLPEPTAIDYANAIKKFNDYDDKSYSFIWDSGYCSPILAKAMNSVAIEKNAQFVPSFPPKYRKVDDVLAYHKSLGLNTFQGVEVVPGHKGTYCGSFLTTVPGSLSYINARVNSFNNGTSECQPLFGPTRGAVTAPNLIWNINKTDQQKLADQNINSIISNINGTYLNFNLTSQKATSYLSEEQNVYMSNVIAHVCEEYNPKIIGELNDAKLRLNVINQLTQLINTRIVGGKKPTLNAFRVICDDKLNTQDVIEARQLKYKVEVQYLPSIAYITCYVDVVRLNSF